MIRETLTQNTGYRPILKRAGNVDLKREDRGAACAFESKSEADRWNRKALAAMRCNICTNFCGTFYNRERDWLGEGMGWVLSTVSAEQDGRKEEAGEQGYVSLTNGKGSY
jgi:hypothetical protein